MSVETRIEKLQLEAEKELKDVFKDIDKIAKNVNKEGRKIVERMTKTSTANHEAFLKELEKAGSPKFVRDFEKFLATAEMGFTGSGSEYTAGTGFEKGIPGRTVFDTGPLREAWKAFADQTNKSMGFDIISGQQAHQDIGVIGQRAFILYTRQVMLNRDIKDNVFLLALGQTQAEVFRNVYMASIALLSPGAWKELKGVGKQSLEDAESALDYFERNTTQEEWELHKQKTINVLTGKDEQVLKIVAKQPKAQTDAEYAIATEMQKAYDENYAQLTSSFTKNFTKLKGSNPFEDEVVKQLTTLAAGKKPKPYRSATKKRYKPRKNNSSVKGSAKLKKLKARKKKIKIKSLAPMKKRKKGEKMSEATTVTLLKLKSLLNKRLPAAVRNNMGGKFLTNRSGQFANSVRIEQLRQAPKGLSADYTYTKTGGGTGGKPRVGVYQVFEHPGSIHGNPNHDPRPLIVKSIRELAMQYTDEKFSYLRRI